MKKPKAKKTPTRRSKPLSRLSPRRRRPSPAPAPDQSTAPASAGAVVAGPSIWAPPWKPHQRVRIYVHASDPMEGHPTIGGGPAVRWPLPPAIRNYRDHWGSSGWYGDLKAQLRAGRVIIAVGHEEGVMVAYLAPAPGNA